MTQLRKARESEMHFYFSYWRWKGGNKIWDDGGNTRGKPSQVRIWPDNQKDRALSQCALLISPKICCSSKHLYAEQKAVNEKKETDTFSKKQQNLDLILRKTVDA